MASALACVTLTDSLWFYSFYLVNIKTANTRTYFSGHTLKRTHTQMHMAFLITWGCPPAAGETHLGTERNACAKSKGGWEGWALMRGISGTHLMVTFLPGTAGLSVKVGPLPQGPLDHSALSSSCNRARHSKTSSPSNRRQLKLSSAYTPGNTWLATSRREEGRGSAWGHSLEEGWWNLFVSRNGK